MPIQVSRAVSQSTCRSIKTHCHLPREMTFPSAHHSPNTVNRKARELVIGTVKLSSRETSAARPLTQTDLLDTFRDWAQFLFFHVDRRFPLVLLRLMGILEQTNKQERTSLPNQQEEPNTPRNINQQWDRIRRPPKQIQHRVDHA